MGYSRWMCIVERGFLVANTLLNAICAEPMSVNSQMLSIYLSMLKVINKYATYRNSVLCLLENPNFKN